MEFSPAYMQSVLTDVNEDLHYNIFKLSLGHVCLEVQIIGSAGKINFTAISMSFYEIWENIAVSIKDDWTQCMQF